jgi:hypothetical protein
MMEVDIVDRIDKLIKSWEREYGITNKTMVDAMNTIIRLRSGPGGIMEMKQTIADKETRIEKLEITLRDIVEQIKQYDLPAPVVTLFVLQKAEETLENK